jgi:hypothetical protein
MTPSSFAVVRMDQRSVRTRQARTIQAANNSAAPAVPFSQSTGSSSNSGQPSESRLRSIGLARVSGANLPRSLRVLANWPILRGKKLFTGREVQGRRRCLPQNVGAYVSRPNGREQVFSHRFPPLLKHSRKPEGLVGDPFFHGIVRRLLGKCANARGENCERP